MTTTPDTTAETTEPSYLDLAEIGLEMDKTLKRLAMLQSQKILRNVTKELGTDEQGQLDPTTETSAVIMGMLDVSISLGQWLTEYLYAYENQTFDENTTIALTTARRAQAAVAELNAASYALERELRHLIVNNRMRRQGVEYLNDLQHTIELAKEYQQEQAEKGEES